MQPNVPFDSTENEPFDPNFVHQDEADLETPRGPYFQESDRALLTGWLSDSVPIELEIGSGKGLYLTRMASEHAERRYLGLELAKKYAIDCQQHVEKRGLSNIRFLACDAVAVMDRDVPSASLDAVHVYFPDPWWKSRHKKRRVLTDATIVNIERALKPQGQLHFWTDVLDYYEDSLERIDALTQLKGPFFVSEPPAHHDMDYRTHFERRTRRNGLPVYRARFSKP